MSETEKPNRWLKRGWDDVRPNLLWWIIQGLFGSGLLAGAYAVARSAANENVTLASALIVFGLSCFGFVIASLYVHSRQRGRGGTGAVMGMAIYLPIVLGLGFCVWAYFVGARVRYLDSEATSLRSNLDLYVKPRSLSEGQIAAIAAELSKSDPQNVNVVVLANDAEAANYMGQIVSGLVSGG
jgi:hypothetical protein